MFNYPKAYDVIVVGGGHAGIEASLASARVGCNTLMLTSNPDTIGQMSCNPAIGGQAKGHLVKEITALGGQMGCSADMSGIQFKRLNRSKGPAVWSTRVQCDKKHYQSRIRHICELAGRLDIKLGECAEVLVDEGNAIGVETTLGVRFYSKSVVLTTGTFLQGLMHVGPAKTAGGRFGDSAAFGLSANLRKLGFELGRLKTGTPPRLSRRSIDVKKCLPQIGDDPPPFFSTFAERLFHVEHTQSRYDLTGVCANNLTKKPLLKVIGKQELCFLTKTTIKTADIVKRNLHKSPLYGGDISGIGPRYCPSIEDKIVKFESKNQNGHQIFLEPESIHSEEIYINGLSSSFPLDIQYELVRSVVGCENAEIVRPAYAVEYDFVFPHQLDASLETKMVRRLFLAGQINGTSGYEEAAAQGLIAGINAAGLTLARQPTVIRRDQAYIGVLIDDLVTKSVTEPYRVFTSRAEHRLELREDNADLRLTQLGFDIGLISKPDFEDFLEKKRLIASGIERIQRTRLDGFTVEELLRRPGKTLRGIMGDQLNMREDIERTVEAMVKYDGYIRRQATEIERNRSLDARHIPDEFDYDLVPSLKTEARQKLKRGRPKTLGQAAKISGVSPSDISNLIIWLKAKQHP